MIKFDCTNCGHKYRVSDEYGGKRVRCKQCSTINKIEMPEQEAASCEDSIAAYNQLLQDLLKCEQDSRTLERNS